VSITDTDRRVDLVVSGMTCAACASRIEKKLNRLDGITASVNYATESANVVIDDPTRTAGEVIDALIHTVRSIGYDAALPAPLGAPIADSGGGTGEPESDTVDPALVALRQRLLTACLLGLPVLVMSMIPALQFRNWQWLSFALAAPVATWCAWPFHRTAWKNLRQAEATMDTLVSVGVTAAFAWSAYALFLTPAGDNGMTMSMSIVPQRGDSHHLYLEVASATVALILLGRWFEARAKHTSAGALRALANLQATAAHVLMPDGSEQVVPASSLTIGQHFVVRPGERIATDGVVVDGHSAVDNSLVTGESMPVEVTTGDSVIGATVNTVGRLVVRAERVGSDTTLAQIHRLVQQAQTGKAPVQRLADRVSGVFVPVVVTLAVATLGWWWARTGSASSAMAPAVAVLIIACPCALGLATPTALLVGTGRGAELGILIRGPHVLEDTRRVDTVVLDKTGTITTGQMRVAAVHGSDTLAVAAAVEAGSEHPIGVAIVAEAVARGLSPVAADGIRSHPGSAISGSVQGREVWVGRPEHTDSGTHLTRVEVRIDGESIGTIDLGDDLRDSSIEGIARLRALGLRPVLVTGDHAGSAVAVAAEVGIDSAEVRAGVLPDGKVDVIRELQAAGRVVAMVGDGINDAAALAQADLGISMGSGTDVAKEASDLTITRPSLVTAADSIRLGRRTLAVIKGNLLWAFLYNVAAIPLAMSWRLSPVVASAAMAFSSVFVVSNSLRLRRFR
jgi:Cu+-exporting ATPase